MIHWVKMFLYYHSFRILFKKYRDKWFNDQLWGLIIDTLKDLPQGFLENAWLGKQNKEKL